MKFVRKGFEIRLIGAIIVTIYGGIYVFKPNYWLIAGVILGMGILFFGGSNASIFKFP